MMKISKIICLKKMIFISKIFVLSLTLILKSINLWSIQYHGLKEAVDEGLIEARIKGNPERPGAWQGEAIDITLVNKTNAPMEIELNQGTRLIPDDEKVQDMVVAKDYTYSLEAEQQLDPPILAFCLEYLDKPPTPEINFKVGTKVNNKILSVLKEIEKREIYDETEAQYAIWYLTDSVLPDNKEDLINSFDILQSAGIDISSNNSSSSLIVIIFLILFIFICIYIFIRKTGTLTFPSRLKCPGCGEELLSSWPFCPFCKAVPSKMDTKSNKFKGKYNYEEESLNKEKNVDVRAILTVINGLNRGREYGLNDGDNFIGKGETCLIILNDDYVSQLHAVIKVANTDLILTDLNSMNGTYLNNCRIDKPQFLKDGDLIQMGSVQFEVRKISYK